MADTLKLCAKAAGVAPGASQPLVLQAWAYMVAGNVTAVLDVCAADALLSFDIGETNRTARSTKRPKVSKGGARQLEQALPEAPELWVMAGRALHLSGRGADARRLLAIAVARNVETRASHPLADPPLAPISTGPLMSSPSARVPLARLPQMTSRDVQRLVRECRYEMTLIDKLQLRPH